MDTNKEITNWKPKPNEHIIWKNMQFKLISIDMGGKCKIQKLRLPRKGMQLREIDITELKPNNN